MSLPILPRNETPYSYLLADSILYLMYSTVSVRRISQTQL